MSSMGSNKFIDIGGDLYERLFMLILDYHRNLDGRFPLYRTKRQTFVELLCEGVTNHYFCCCFVCHIFFVLFVSLARFHFRAPLISDREGKSIEGKNVFIVACLGEKSALSAFGCDFVFTKAIYNF